MFNPSDDTVSGTYTSSNTGSAIYSPDSIETAGTYGDDADEQRLGALLITNDGFYIADDNGMRIILGGLSISDVVPDETGVTWIPDTDII